MKYGNAFLGWLPLALAITGLCLLTGVTVQQNYRQSLNDPQIQMAEDAARSLAGGASPAVVIGNSSKVDIAESLSPWIAVYDENGTAVGSTGLLDGALPVLPEGVLNDAATNNGKDSAQPGQNRVTWQPRDGVREAVVVQHYSGKNAGFAVAGRNMREVEDREGGLNTIVALAWVALLASTLVVQLAATYLQRR